MSQEVRLHEKEPAVAKDEEQIRALVTKWHSSTAAGDVDAVLSLMVDDVVFLVAGRPPMRGRGAFEKALRELSSTHRIESDFEIVEIDVSGALAYCWTNLKVRIVPVAGGTAMLRSGSALSILRRQVDGSWRVVRDANLLSGAT